MAAAGCLQHLHRRRHQGTAGTEHAQRAVERDERTGEEHDVGRQAHPEVRQHDHELLHDPRIDRAAGADVIGHQAGQRPLQLVRRGRFGDVGDALDAIAEQGDVAPGEGEEHVDDRRLLDRVEAPDGAEVDHAERAVLEDEDVARMRVGMEEAEAHHLVEHRAQQLIGERRPIGSARLTEPADVADRRPLEALLHEDPAGAQVAVQRRHAHGSVAVEPGRHLGHGVGLAPEVELGPEPGGELGEHVARAQPSAERCPALGELGEQRQRSEVALDRRVDARPLDLDDDGLAGAQPRPVGLADRRCGERLPVELAEDGVEVAARARPRARRRCRRRGSGGTRFCNVASSAHTSLGSRSTRVAAI